ncbi:LapA family protein [Rhodopseudomonas sp. HC1]|uniref:LapA family protein n=1 Tax=Rhodopseudomonas infernalis TaxID=2897386 RepID=UPI001EE7E601|nr:LapA family protein [Rhodopseudomonas infernalis]MCG6207886.1 LapA family protein [Rhodopseudomonas infernalis]
MQKFLTALVLIPLGLIFIVFAVANRHLVTVSFDPLEPSDPMGNVQLPLFVLIIGVAILGVIAGGIATWFRQSKWRRAARRHQAEAIEAKAELANLRASVMTPASNEPRRLQLERSSAAGRRDKADAAL